MHTNTRVNKWSQIEPSSVYVMGLLIALLTFTQSVLAETLVFGPGVYDLTTPVVIDADNSYIELQPGAVLRGVDPIIIINGPVKNIGVYGHGTLEGGVRTIGAVINLSLENFTITLATNAVLIDGQGSCQDLRITGLTIHDVGEGIVFRNCQDFSITNNTIRDMWAQDGIEPANSQRGVISNNRVMNPGPGNAAIDVFVNTATSPGELAEVSSVTISNNILTRTIPGFLTSGIDINGNVVGVTLQGNQIVGTFKNGIRLLKGSRDISISDHIFRGLRTGISLVQCENLKITDSQFIDITKWSIVTGTDIKGPVIIQGNLFSGDAQHFAGAADATIDANIFMGNGWAIANGFNPVINAINNDFRGPKSISSPNASNLFTRDNIGE